jgi:hypothetical protein
MINEAGIVAHIKPINWNATGKVTQVGSGERDWPINAVTATSNTLPVLSNALQKERARTPKFIKVITVNKRGGETNWLQGIHRKKQA